MNGTFPTKKLITDLKDINYAKLSIKRILWWATVKKTCKDLLFFQK